MRGRRAPQHAGRYTHRLRQTAILVLLLFPTLAAGRMVEQGIPVTDPMTKAKCGSCHNSDDRGNMKRISWERATPEGWELALQRMILLYDVEVTPAEKEQIIQYLSTYHGLAPDEAKTVAYDVERRSHEDNGTPNAVVRACGRCHNLARVFSWRRSFDDWKELFDAHAVRYNAPANDEVISFISKTAPLHTPQWMAWADRGYGKSPAGRWLVTVSVLDSVRYTGEMQVDPNGGSGQLKTRATLHSVTDGSTVVRTGSGTLYGGYAWRGFSMAVNHGSSTPDDLSNDAREVITTGADESNAEGRWFWGQYQELGFDIKMQRASPDATLLGIDRRLLKAGSQSNRVRIFGDHFPDQVSPTDLDFGRGTTARRIVSHNASEITAEVDVAFDAPPGKRSIAFRGSVLPAATAIYDRVDYIKVMPESAMASFGNQTRRRGYQQFAAIAYQNGPDGKRHTDDDVELGPIDVKWSLKIFYESEGTRTDSVGSVSPSGLFMPAGDSPDNNFDVWVIAQSLTEKDEDGEPLTGKSYLVVTVPVYVFSGRRYVREFDRWVDDGPARPVQ